MPVTTFTMEMRSSVVIGKYIRQLLTEGKRVILPGFGNLQIKEISGEVPPSGGRIHPPGPTVRFDEKYSKDDGLLASAYAAGEHMDPGEAEQQVLELVDAIRFALDKGESYTLPDTGTFTRDDEGKVHFKKEPAWILEPEQYGLDSMELLELDELAEVETGTGEEAPPEIAPPEEAPGEEALQEKGTREPVKAERPVARFTPSWAVPEPPEKKKSRAGRWKVIWIIAGSLIVILLLLIFVPVNRTEEGGFEFGREGMLLKHIRTRPGEKPAAGQAEQPAAGQAEESASGQTGAPAPGQAEQPDAGQAEGSVPVQAEEPAARQTEAPAAAHYYVIAGSFRHLGNASEMQDELRSRGYDAGMMITEDRMYRVHVASYATKEEALRGLEGIRSEPGLENCWLLSR
jgi:nucleoid DNA-binding protein/cell division septation protein DedD